MHRFLDPILFLVYTVASVTGLILVKSQLPAAKSLLANRDFLSRPVLLVLSGAAIYVASFAVWLIILGRNELSVAYPIAVGLTLVFSTLAAGAVLEETISMWRIFGIVIVFGGIWIIARS